MDVKEKIKEIAKEVAGEDDVMDAILVVAHSDSQGRAKMRVDTAYYSNSLFRKELLAEAIGVV